LEVVDETFYVWGNLREECVFGLEFLRKYRLLSFMESGVLPIPVPTVEVVEDAVLQGAFDRFDSQFESMGTDLSAEEMETLLVNDSFIDPKFPLVDELRSMMRTFGPRLFGRMSPEGT